mgnify:CR=1 FL=1
MSKKLAIAGENRSTLHIGEINEDRIYIFTTGVSLNAIVNINKSQAIQLRDFLNEFIEEQNG